VLGSPVRALKFGSSFGQLHFFDLDEARAENLRQLKKDFNHPGVTVHVG